MGKKLPISLKLHSPQNILSYYGLWLSNNLQYIHSLAWDIFQSNTGYRCMGVFQLSLSWKRALTQKQTRKQTREKKKMTSESSFGSLHAKESYSDQKIKRIQHQRSTTNLTPVCFCKITKKWACTGGRLFLRDRGSSKLATIKLPRGKLKTKPVALRSILLDQSAWGNNVLDGYGTRQGFWFYVKHLERVQPVCFRFDGQDQP